MTIIDKSAAIYRCPECESLITGRLFTTTSYSIISPDIFSDGSVCSQYMPKSETNIAKCPNCEKFIYLNNVVGLFPWGKYYRFRRVKNEFFVNIQCDWRCATNITVGKYTYFHEKITEEIPEEYNNFIDAPSVMHLSLKEVVEALGQGVVKSKKNEIDERVILWWYVGSDEAIRELAFENGIELCLPSGLDAIRGRQHYLGKNCIDLDNLTSEIDVIKKKNLQRLLKLLSEDDPRNLVMKGEILRQLGMFEEAIQVLEMVPSEDKWASIQIIQFAKTQDKNVRQLKPPTE